MHYIHPLYVKIVAYIADNFVALVLGGILGHKYGHVVEAWVANALNYLKRKV